MRSQKCVKRQLERKWRTSGLECDRRAYCIQRQLVTSSVHRAKLEYHASQIVDASGDQKQLFQIVAKHNLHNDNDTPLPPCDLFDHLQRGFQIFLSEKISKIRSELIQNVNNVDASVEDALQTCLLTAFEPATEAEIGTLLKSSPVKSCELDLIPTWLLRDCARDIVPGLTTIVNLSLRTGVVPSHMKGAHVRTKPS